MIVGDFNPRKTAQGAAYFVRVQGGRINVLKLVKLIYLADREFLLRHGEPMIDDRWVSMPHGPVNSGTYDMIQGMQGADPDWDDFIGRRDDHDIPLARDLIDDDFDYLATLEYEVLAWT